jgi:hypothetical protein
MKSFSFFIVSLFLVLLFSCQESALSDVEITDPSLIYAELELEKDIKSGTTTTDRAIGRILDKNRYLMKLKNGSVWVNDQQLEQKNDPVVKLPYYRLVIDRGIGRNEQYRFEVVLSNGDTYPAEVITQSIENVVIPESITVGDSMVINWENAGSDEIIKLYTRKTFEDTSTAGEQNIFTIENPESGEYVLPATFFENKLQITSIKFTLESIKNGEISSAFRTSSYVRSLFYYEQTCTINQEK